MESAAAAPRPVLWIAAILQSTERKKRTLPYRGKTEIRNCTSWDHFLARLNLPRHSSSCRCSAGQSYGDAEFLILSRLLAGWDVKCRAIAGRSATGYPRRAACAKAQNFLNPCLRPGPFREETQKHAGPFHGGCPKPGKPVTATPVRPVITRAGMDVCEEIPGLHGCRPDSGFGAMAQGAEQVCRRSDSPALRSGSASRPVRA